MVAARRDADVPDLAQPADVLPRRVRAAAPASSWRRRRRSGSASRASTRKRVELIVAGVDVPRDRDGAVRLRRADDQRVGAARGHRARRDRPPRPRRLVRRPARDPARVGQGARASLLAGPRSTHATSHASRSSCSTRPASCTVSTTNDRELLEYAALLHDIGEHVSHDGHDRHAAYLVAPRPAPRLRPRGDPAAHRTRALAPPRRARRPATSSSAELDGDRRAASSPRCCASPTVSTAAASRWSRHRRARSARRSCSCDSHADGDPSSSSGARGASGSCSRRCSTATSS